MLDVIRDDTTDVFLTGRRPGGTLPGFLRWVEQVPDGWREADDGHYLANKSRPVLSYIDAAGRTVRIQRAHGWFGDEADTATPQQCRDAFELLNGALMRRFDPDARVLATPATTGRDLWLRSLPEHAEYEVLPEDVRALIRSTSGQGRWERFTPGESSPAAWWERRAEREGLRPAGATMLPGLYGYDMRFGYAALLWGLGVGPVQHDDRPEFEGMRRGRYRVVFTVPDGWAHIGLLPVKDDEGGWVYPAVPGERHETWADGAEVHLALKHGWRVEVRERLLLADGRPLDGWRDRLLKVRDSLAAAHRDAPDAARLAAGAARAIVLHTVGAFHAPPREVTHRVTDPASPLLDDATNVEPMPGGGFLVTRTEAPAWPECAHPEWSTAVWARCRARIAAHALDAPYSSLVAIRTDALYASAPLPITDTRRVGALRPTTRIDRPVPVPESAAELVEVARAA